MGLFRLLAAFAAAVLVMTVLGSLAQTQFVIAALKRTGAPVGWGERLAMSGADLIGFAPLYAALIAIGFLIAFAAAALVLRLVALPRTQIYGLAGAACVALMLVLMREVFFGIPLLAGAREPLGFAAQAGAGLIAGVVFALLTRPSRAGEAAR